VGRSLIKQCNDALDRLLRIGHSRHADKARGQAGRWIYSYRTRSTYGGRVIAAVKWIKANTHPDLRELRQLTPDDLRAYIRHMERSGHAGGGIRSTISALRKLEHGLHELRWLPPRAQLVPDDLRTSTPRSGPRLGFGPEQADAILAHVSAEARLVLRIQRAAGLRIQEVARLQDRDIDRQEGTITIRSSKGGKDRIVSQILDPALLGELPEGRHWLMDNPGALVRRVQAEVRDACRALEIDTGSGRNTHAFRALYAEELLRSLLASHEDMTEDTAREILSAQLGHQRRSVTYRYAPRLTSRIRRAQRR
jgi:integrase